jgi:hypothetical protein
MDEYFHRMKVALVVLKYFNTYRRQNEILLVLYVTCFLFEIQG